jgi:predicted ester cyclase/SAM-dependent methyltransferase
MIETAQAATRREGLANAAFAHADAQVHPFPPATFDVALSRFGSMFFADQAGAFANIGRALRPEARLLLVSWRSAAENEWITILREALRPGGHPPEAAANEPGAFRHADRADTAAILAAAGYHDIAIDPLDLPVYFGRDAADAYSVLGPLFAWMVSDLDLDPAAAGRAFGRMRQALRARQTAGGVSDVADYRPAQSGTTKRDRSTTMNQNNEQLLRQFLAAFEASDLGSIKDLTDPDIIDHTLPPGAAPGIEGLLYAVAAYQQGFPDLRISIDKVVSDGDCAVGYGRISGTNTGSFFGMPPTGKAADFGYIDMYRIDSGRITEAWHIEDIAGLMRQLAPTSGSAPA